MAPFKTAKRAKKLAKSFEESVIADARLIYWAPKDKMFAPAAAEFLKSLIKLGEYAIKDGVGNSLETLVKVKPVKELQVFIEGAQILAMKQAPRHGLHEDRAYGSPMRFLENWRAFAHLSRSDF